MDAEVAATVGAARSAKRRAGGAKVVVKGIMGKAKEPAQQ